VEQLEGIRCPSPGWTKEGKIFSCSDAIAKVMDQSLRKEKQKISNIVGVCPDCGDALRHVEGCMVCKGCGYSKC
jgi:ribonucleoside-diphosphate reductase alpha chain